MTGFVGSPSYIAPEVLSSGGKKKAYSFPVRVCSALRWQGVCCGGDVTRVCAGACRWTAGAWAWCCT